MASRTHNAAQERADKIKARRAGEVTPRRLGKNLQTVTQFNAHCPIGSSVLFWPGERTGPGRASRTRSEAWLLGGTPVVLVEDYPGGIALSHVMPYAPGHSCDVPNCDGTRLGHDLASEFPDETRRVDQALDRLARPREAQVLPENLQVNSDG